MNPSCPSGAPGSVQSGCGGSAASASILAHREFDPNSACEPDPGQSDQGAGFCPVQPEGDCGIQRAAGKGGRQCDGAPGNGARHRRGVRTAKTQAHDGVNPSCPSGAPGSVQSGCGGSAASASILAHREFDPNSAELSGAHPVRSNSPGLCRAQTSPGQDAGRFCAVCKFSFARQSADAAEPPQPDCTEPGAPEGRYGYGRMSIFL